MARIEMTSGHNRLTYHSLNNAGRFYVDELIMFEIRLKTERTANENAVLLF